MSAPIPISVIVITKNEGVRIAQCLAALLPFDEVIVVDSNSDDETRDVAKNMGARVVDYVWDGQYPKKRQWCLDHLDLKHDWIFFVDADEIVTRVVVQEIAEVFHGSQNDVIGFFVRSHYVWCGKMLRYGLKNSKLVLFDRRYIGFPVVHDLSFDGMGEVEGHYQPVIKVKNAAFKLGVLKGCMLHNIGDDMMAWNARHLRYAQWEVMMNKYDAWPRDPVAFRQVLKRVFRSIPLRPAAAFLHCYIFKFGFIDGYAGFDFARSRARYYRMISDCVRSNKD